MKKITLFFVCLMMSVVAFSATAASNLRGDVNGNYEVDISDVTALIGYVLTGNGSSLVLANADCTLNGEIDISDVTCLIDYVLRGAWPEDPHEWVDLGLPSGTLWATCNVGADSPEEYGDYFAWGETAPKEYYDWDNYKWCDGTYYTLTKYCTNADYGTVDNKVELEPVDDAASVNWGSSWRMPTTEQQNELCENCTWEWETRNGVNGQLVYGPNGKTIFLPAAGVYRVGMLWWASTDGQYWSRSLYNYSSYGAYAIHFTADYYSNWYSDSRREGRTVRAVRASQN